MRLLLSALALLMIAGCSTTHLQTTSASKAPTHLKARHFQVKIPTSDGQQLAATVFQPELQPGRDAPLIITTGGWGGSRAKHGFSLFGHGDLTKASAIAAWKAGYWVVFYDQRGWGGSSGHVHMVAPKFEVADVSRVIDWSLGHLPAVHRLNDGSPAIGMIGESYGAGVMTVAAFRDKRIKAIVPLSGWYDLNSVAPNGQSRSAWSALLLGSGAFSSGFDIGSMLAKPWRSALAGSISPQAKELMYHRSPAWYCDQGKTPYPDALFVQGFHDTIFPFSQAERNQQCWQRQGRDARVIGLQSTHNLPWPVQSGHGMGTHNADKTLHCGDYEDSTTNAVLSFWNEKLRGEERQLPDTCINVSDDNGVALKTFPTASDEFGIPRSKVVIPLAGAFEWLMTGFDIGSDLFRGLWPGVDLRDLKPVGGIGRPKFIPVYVARGDDELLLGTPRIDLALGGVSGKEKMPVFVGIGVQHANHRRVKVASEQLTPLPKKGIYRLQLQALSQKLKPGDRVGLVVYGFTAQFPLNSALLARQAVVSGHLWLPLTRAEDVAMKDRAPK
ncbi:MAG: CocE/NonD family hydrolase [Alcanivorax sp.]|nr:CocE/NonD family hydrolase [Alcanivorax sp.]